MYTYTQDRKYDKWETLADHFDVMLDELNAEDETQDVFIPVDEFDVDEVL
jgi:CRISPR/Cas system CSM-associated protein Csm2 small subunit